VEYATLSILAAILHRGGKALCYHTRQTTNRHPEGVDHHSFRKALPIRFSQSISALFHYACFNKVDILHFPHPKILYLKKPKVPFILTMHDLIPLIYPSFFPKRYSIFFKYFLPKYLNEAAAIIAVSHQTKRDLLKYFRLPEEKIHVIYPSLLPKKREITFEKERYFFYIGSFEPRKNLKGIIEAFSLFKSWGLNYRLILAGPQNPPLELSLENEIIYLGYISEEQKEKLFQKATALVWPSYYEGFGYPLLEAMHYGTPIITSFGSSTEEIVNDAALLVHPENPVEIAEAMKRIASSSELRCQLIEKGLKRSLDFSFEKMSASLMEFYGKHHHFK
jgi:glycosyltransferase involved in cell wall biosynthesis